MEFKSLLIKDTTEEERRQIVAESLGAMDGMCDGCAPGIIDMYDAYIAGEKELAEVNAEFRRGYSMDHGKDDDGGRSCMM